MHGPETATGAVILAAGRGSRMSGGEAKPARRLLGVPLVRRVVNAARGAGAEPIVVVVAPGEAGGAEVRKAAGDGVVFVVQERPLGTGDAALAARVALGGFAGRLFLLVGDAPAVRPEELRGLAEHHETRNAALTFASAVYDETPPYGRIVRDSAGRIFGIIEEADATEAQRALREVITSQYLVEAPLLWELLALLRPKPRSGEKNLTDIVRLAVMRRLVVEAWRAPEPERLLGVNTAEELERMAGRMKGERALEAPEPAGR